MATRTCLACDAPATLDAQFCGECGSALTGGPTETPPFTVGDSLRSGWRITRSNLMVLVAVTFVFLAVAIIVQSALDRVPREDLLASFMANVLWLAVIGVIQVSMILISLKLCDGVRPRLADLLPNSVVVLRFIYVSLLFNLIVIGGLVLLVVPGVLWGCMFAMAPYLVVDRGYGAVDALRASARMTAGSRWRVLGLFLAAVALIVAGLLALLVGVLVTFPLTQVAWAYAYRRLLARTPGMAASTRTG
jgi:hypothetical protein